MIYLVDEEYYEMSHSYKMIKILEDQQCFDYTHIVLDKSKDQEKRIKNALINLLNIVKDKDVVLCSWIYKKRNYLLDDLIYQLANKCFLIAPTGNTKDNMQEYIPCRCKNIYKAACLNKSGIPATFNNYNLGDNVCWIVGTNYKISEDVYETGTCVSAAILSTIIFKSINADNLDMLIETIYEYNTQQINKYNNRNTHDDTAN